MESEKTPLTSQKRYKLKLNDLGSMNKFDSMVLTTS